MGKGSAAPGADQRTTMPVIAPTPARSPAVRRGDWCCRCRSSVCSSSWPPPAGVAACSSESKNGEKKQESGWETPKIQKHHLKPINTVLFLLLLFWWCSDHKRVSNPLDARDFSCVRLPHQGVSFGVTLGHWLGWGSLFGRAVAVVSHVLRPQLEQRLSFAMQRGGVPRVRVVHPFGRVLPGCSFAVQLQGRWMQVSCDAKRAHFRRKSQ